MLTKYPQIRAEVWSQINCLACDQAKKILESRYIQYNECMLGINGYSKKDLINKIPNARSVPQIFLNGKLIGGLQELKKELADYDNNKVTTMG